MFSGRTEWELKGAMGGYGASQGTEPTALATDGKRVSGGRLQGLRAPGHPANRRRVMPGRLVSSRINPKAGLGKLG